MLLVNSNDIWVTSGKNMVNFTKPIVRGCYINKIQKKEGSWKPKSVSDSIVERSRALSIHCCIGSRYRLGLKVRIHFTST